MTVFWDDDRKPWDDLKRNIPADRHILSDAALEAIEAGNLDDVVDVPCIVTLQNDIMPDQVIVGFGLPAKLWVQALRDMSSERQSKPLQALAGAMVEAWARALAARESGDPGDPVE